MTNYSELRKIALREIKSESNKELVKMTLDIYEKTGKSIDEPVKRIASIKVKDDNDIEQIKKVSEWYCDDSIISDYQQQMSENGYCLYSNYDKGDKSLEFDVKYLKENNIDFIIGLAHDIFANKLENVIGLYIKGWKEDEEVNKIVQNMPKQEFNIEELLQDFSIE